MAKAVRPSSKTWMRLHSSVSEPNHTAAPLLTCRASHKRDEPSVSEESHRHQRVFDIAISFPDSKGYEASATEDNRADDCCTLPRVEASSLLQSVSCLFLKIGEYHTQEIPMRNSTRPAVHRNIPG